MESCLTLVRAFYASQEDMVKDFIDIHPTKDKQRFLSKILSQMMIKCNSDIEMEQVMALQEHKHEPSALDYTTHNYSLLIDIDWDDMRYKPEPTDGDEPQTEVKGTGPIEMSQ